MREDRHAWLGNYRTLKVMALAFAVVVVVVDTLSKMGLL